MLKAIKDLSTYRIVRKIADGGMGSVYEAIQDGANGFQKTVAIKTLLPQLCEMERFVEMFVQEAKLVANLVHENIVQIYQLGRTPDGYYFAMEYVNGLSVHEFVRFHNLTKTPVPLPLAVFITSRIARGLAYAHSRVDAYGEPMRIVHRDVCPNNVMITTEGLPKLTDFGIAVITSQMRGDEMKALMGKLTYMSPEQAQKQIVDFRTDIFALGAVLFELLSGAKIRQGSDQDVAIEMAKKGFVDWGRLPGTVPEELRGILQHCLAYNPKDRYDNTHTFARELEYYIYKDGYGPTIQVLEEYLRKQFAYLYQVKRKVATPTEPARDDLGPGNVAATVIME